MPLTSGVKGQQRPCSSELCAPCHGAYVYHAECSFDTLLGGPGLEKFNAQADVPGNTYTMQNAALICILEGLVLKSSMLRLMCLEAKRFNHAGLLHDP